MDQKKFWEYYEFHDFWLKSMDYRQMKMTKNGRLGPQKNFPNLMIFEQMQLMTKYYDFFLKSKKKKKFFEKVEN